MEYYSAIRKNTSESLVRWMNLEPVIQSEVSQRKTNIVSVQFSSVQSVQSVMSDSSRPHGLQHARLPCPSPIPGAYSNSSPSSW